MAELRHTAKDSVFRSLFSDKKYLLQLYRTLHPEDKTAKETDLDITTIERLLYNGEYNDLGFSVKDKLIILVEAQSNWSENIVMRSLIYMVSTYHSYFLEHNINLLNTKIKAKIPKPELYVIYLGNKGKHPETLSLQKEFFNGRDCCIEAKVKVIYTDGSGSIIDQYIQFGRVLNQQTKLHGKTRKAIEETFKICSDRNILKEYLSKHESEAVTIMMTLFSQERIDQFKHDEAIAEGIVIGRDEGIGIGREEGLEIGREEGIGIGSLYTMNKLVKDKKITKTDAAESLGMSVAEFDKKCKELSVSSC